MRSTGNGDPTLSTPFLAPPSFTPPRPRLARRRGAHKDWTLNPIAVPTPDLLPSGIATFAVPNYGIETCFVKIILSLFPLVLCAL